MKRFKIMSLRQKRTLAIFGIGLAVLTIGGTIAYNQNSAFFNNLFRLPSDVAEFFETFDSPEDWTPCTETPKTAVATNKNASPRYVRMKINEYWRTKDTQTPITDHETTDLPLTWNDSGTTKHYAVINTQNDDKWELNSDGWYYYKTTLAQDESTDSLLKSVTFNCEVNLAGETTYTDGGHVSESNPIAYADANYHLFITFQMSDEPMAPSQHTADCDNNLLYDAIACQTNGPDDGIDFYYGGTVDNGLGVNTLSAHKDDYYPTYYFRGEVDNNNVVWGGICWLAMRTTETGGVKMIHNGYPQNGTCPGTSSSPVSNSAKWADTTTEYRSPGQFGYKYGRLLTEYKNTDYLRWGGSLRHFGNDVNYNEETGKYTLVDTIQLDLSNGMTQAHMKTVVETAHRYVCLGADGSGECATVEFLVDWGDYPTGFILSNGAKNFEELMYDDILGNQYNSPVKSTIEGWFGAVIGNELEEDLEDTIFCNDRSIARGPLKGHNETWEYIVGGSSDNQQYTDFGGKGRYDFWSADRTYEPTIDCARPEDRFTVSSANGNGELAHKVGLGSADEFMLAGSVDGIDRSSTYFKNNTFTMTPYHYFWYYPYVVVTLSGGLTQSIQSSGYPVFPVVSLKAGTTYAVGGDGTASNPYVIE